MVKSKLDENINYPEIKILDEEDINYEASLYEINILGKDIIIALGQAKYSYIDNNIVYYPIYLVKNDKVKLQLGLYEILANMIPNILDEEGDVDIEIMYEPIVYDYVVEEPNILGSTEKNELRDEDTDDDSDEDDIDDELVSDYSPLEEQTKEIASKEKSEFKKGENTLWIENYMHNNNYHVIDNEGGGDCLFAVIRDGLKKIGKKTSVEELRSLLSSEVNEEIFKNYREQYMMFKTTYDNTNNKMKELNKTNKSLKQDLTNLKDRNEQLLLVEKAKKITKEYKELKSEKELTNEILSEFNFMKKVKNVEQLKELIKSCDFWADTWAISTLERVLNIKLIILSEEAYNEGDKDNVIQCGQLNDEILEKRGFFNPLHYIIVDYTGDHYKLITYKKRGAFSFKELPYDIKNLIVNKCLEKQAGTYYIIPDFKNLHSILLDEDNTDIQDDVEIIPNLYDESTIFQYYSKSANKPLPGKGTGEEILPENVIKFTNLSQIKDWRKKLENSYESPIEIDGLKWKSVDHYYQGSKFKNNNRDFYLLFSLDSDSDISKDISLAKAAGSERGKYKNELVRPKEIVIDEDFYNGRNKQELTLALREKFIKNPDFKNLLIETKDAKLMRFIRGNPPKISTSLMEVRKLLNSN